MKSELSTPLKEWYCARGEKRAGPFTLTQMEAAVRSGKLHKDDLVWREGMLEWSTAESIREVFPTSHQSVASPPPLPVSTEKVVVLREVAIAQKILVFVIASYIVVFLCLPAFLEDNSRSYGQHPLIWEFVRLFESRILSNWVMKAPLFLLPLQTAMEIWLCRSMRWSAKATTFAVLGSWVPYFGVVALLWTNQEATKLLRQHIFRVDWLGVPWSEIPSRDRVVPLQST